MQTTVSELLEISDPIITAVEIATETGHTQLLIQSIANTIESQANTKIDSDALYAEPEGYGRVKRDMDRVSVQASGDNTNTPGLARMLRNIDAEGSTEAEWPIHLLPVQSDGSSWGVWNEATYQVRAVEQKLSPPESPVSGEFSNTALNAQQHSLPSLPFPPQDNSYNVETMRSQSEISTSPLQEKGLYDAIVEHLTYSEFSQKDFLPQDDFESLITEHTVKEELEKAAFGQYDSSLVKYITKHARKTFATLVYGDAVRRAISLERFEFGDKYLPIALEGPSPVSLNGLARDSDAWKWFNKWRTQEKHFFCKEQWVFLPQIFRNDSTMENLHRDCRLPFIACESQGEGGRFSSLHKATIHHAHQTVSSVSIFVLKY